MADGDEWSRFSSDGDAGRLYARVGDEVNNEPPASRPTGVVPTSSGLPTPVGFQSTQEAFGRILVLLGRDDAIADRLVTASPDVAVSTNLGGWTDAKGVYSVEEAEVLSPENRPLQWRPGPDGQHIELRISEMNLFMLLGQLGLAHEHHGEMLLPIGTVYDPFVLRGLDALVYGLYNDSRFIVVGTPSGISFAHEGGAYQSTITPSVGLELPGIVACEPAFARELDWLLCDGLARLTEPRGESSYLRMSTRPIDQEPFSNAQDRIGEDRIKADVLTGGYRLREPLDGEPVLLIASGAVMPEVIEGAERLDDEGVSATVINVTSLDRLYRGWRSPLNQVVATARLSSDQSHLAHLIRPSERRLPMVTVHDASTHAMAWVGAVFGQRVVPAGVDRFGESGTIPDVYESFGLLPGQIVNAALVAVG